MNNIVSGLTSKSNLYISCCTSTLKYIIYKVSPNHERVYHKICCAVCVCVCVYIDVVYARWRRRKWCIVFVRFDGPRRFYLIRKTTHTRAPLALVVHRVRKVLSHRTRHGYYTLARTYTHHTYIHTSRSSDRL